MTVQTHFMSVSTRSCTPIASASIPWRWPRDCRRATHPGGRRSGGLMSMDQTKRTCTGAPPTMSTRFCAGRSQATFRSSSRESSISPQSDHRQGAQADDPRIVPAARRRGDRMSSRREFITLLAALRQRGRSPRVGSSSRSARSSAFSLLSPPHRPRATLRLFDPACAISLSGRTQRDAGDSLWRRGARTHGPAGAGIGCAQARRAGNGCEDRRVGRPGRNADDPDRHHHG